MLSPYRNKPNNTNKRRQKISNANLDEDSHCECDVKRPRLTSFDPKTTTQRTSKESFPVIERVKPKKHKLKGGANIDINDKYLTEILHIINLKWN